MSGNGGPGIGETGPRAGGPAIGEAAPRAGGMGPGICRVRVQPVVPVIPTSWIPASRAIGSAAAVSAGQRCTVNGHGVESTQPVADAYSAVEWQHGRLAFEGEALRYVVQDVNRYSSKPIVIRDERTGNLQVTGTVTEANIAGWINSLQAAFGLQADVQADQIVLRQK